MTVNFNEIILLKYSILAFGKFLIDLKNDDIR